MPTLRVWIDIENLPEFRSALKQWPTTLRRQLGNGFQECAYVLTPELKGAAPVGKTGRLRRETRIRGWREPLGLLFESRAPYAYWTDKCEPHKGWFTETIKSFFPRIMTIMYKHLEKAIRTYQEMYRKVR